MAKIVAMFPGGRRKTYPLDKSRMILGRSEKADISIASETKASRQHLRINFIAGVVTVEDMETSNGTFCEGEKIRDRQIRDRDILTIGETRLQFLYDDDAKPDPPVAKKKRNLATIDRDLIVQMLPDGKWKPIEDPVPYIELLDGEERGLKIAMVSNVNFGRSANCEVLLDQTKLSQNHAQFGALGPDVFVTDLGSTNGTYVNRQRLAPHQPRPLLQGDVVEIGDTRITLRVPAGVEGADRVASGSASGSADDSFAALARYSLLLQGQNGTAKRVALATKTTLGSEQYNQVQLKGRGIAKYHAEVNLVQGDFHLRDLGHRPTFLNGARIRGESKRPLKHGDVISLGNRVMTFEQAGAEVALDKKLKRIRTMARARIFLAILMGGAILAGAAGILMVGTDWLIEQVAPTAANGAYPNGNTGTTPAGDPTELALGFEYVEAAERAQIEGLTGWNVEATGSRTFAILDKTAPTQGSWALQLTPQSPTNQGMIEVYTQTQIQEALAKRLTGPAVDASVNLRARGLTGAIRLYGMLTLNGSATPIRLPFRTIAADEMPEDEWVRIGGAAALPAGQTLSTFSLHIDVMGEVTNLMLDDATVVPAASPTRETLSVPALDQRLQLTLPADNPTRPQIESSAGTLLRDIRVRLLRERPATGLSTRNWRIVATAADAGVARVDRVERGAAVQNGVRVVMPMIAGARRPPLPIGLLMGMARNELGTPRDGSAPAPAYAVRIDPAGDLPMMPGESLALELDLVAPTPQTPMELSVFNARGDRLRLPGRERVYEGVTDFWWSSRDESSRLAVSFDRPISIGLQPNGTPGTPGYAATLTLFLQPIAGDPNTSGPLIDASPAVIDSPTLRIGHTVESWLARGFRMQTDAQTILTIGDPRRYGEALFLARIGLERYRSVPELAAGFRSIINELEPVRQSLMQTITAGRQEGEQAQSVPEASLDVLTQARRSVEAGIDAARQYLEQFPESEDQLQVQADLSRLERVRGALLERIADASSAASEAERAAELRERLQSLATLLRGAERFADLPRPLPMQVEITDSFLRQYLRGPELSTTKAIIFADQIVRSFPEDEFADDRERAEAIRDTIHRLWAWERARPTYLRDELNRLRAGLADGSTSLTSATNEARILAARFPESSHRRAVIGFSLFLQARATLAESPTADAEVRDLLARARRILPTATSTSGATADSLALQVRQDLDDWASREGFRD